MKHNILLSESSDKSSSKQFIKTVALSAMVLVNSGCWIFQWKTDEEQIAHHKAKLAELQDKQQHLWVHLKKEHLESFNKLKKVTELQMQILEIKDQQARVQADRLSGDWDKEKLETELAQAQAELRVAQEALAAALKTEVPAWEQKPDIATLTSNVVTEEKEALLVQQKLNERIAKNGELKNKADALSEQLEVLMQEKNAVQAEVTELLGKPDSLADKDLYRINEDRELTLEALGTGPNAVQARNILIYDNLLEMDRIYNAYVDGIKAWKKWLDTWLEIGAIMASVTATVSKSPSAQKILSAISALFVGASASVNNKVFYDQVLPELLAAMSVGRETIRRQLIVGIQKDTLQFSWIEAKGLLENMKHAGTIDGAVNSISTYTGKHKSLLDQVMRDWHALQDLENRNRNNFSDSDELAKTIELIIDEKKVFDTTVKQERVANEKAKIVLLEKEKEHAAQEYTPTPEQVAELDERIKTKQAELDLLNKDINEAKATLAKAEEITKAIAGLDPATQADQIVEKQKELKELLKIDNLLQDYQDKINELKNIVSGVDALFDEDDQKKQEQREKIQYEINTLKIEKWDEEGKELAKQRLASIEQQIKEIEEAIVAIQSATISMEEFLSSLPAEKRERFERALKKIPNLAKTGDGNVDGKQPEKVDLIPDRPNDWNKQDLEGFLKTLKNQWGLSPENQQKWDELYKKYREQEDQL